MADNYKTKQGQFPASTGSLYTVPASTQSIVRSIVIVNTDSTSHTINMFVNGAAAANQTLKNRTLVAGERIELNAVHTLAASDQIQGNADTGAQVTFTMAVLEITP
jgi:hypothetical protein